MSQATTTTTTTTTTPAQCIIPSLAHGPEHRQGCGRVAKWWLRAFFLAAKAGQRTLSSPVETPGSMANQCAPDDTYLYLSPSGSGHLFGMHVRACYNGKDHIRGEHGPSGVLVFSGVVLCGCFRFLRRYVTFHSSWGDPITRGQ